MGHTLDISMWCNVLQVGLEYQLQLSCDPY